MVPLNFELHVTHNMLLYLLYMSDISNICYFHPCLGRWFKLDLYFSNGLVQPPTSHMLIDTLPKTSSSPWKLGRIPKGNNRIPTPTIHFQVLLLLVLGRVLGCFPKKIVILVVQDSWTIDRCLGTVALAALGPALNVEDSLEGWQVAWISWNT